MATQTPDVFLCHNSADKDWVRHLGERLEAESIDGSASARRIRVFFDEWDIERGENIVVRLGSELHSGAFVAIVMSPEFFTSDWTRLEWTDVVARDPVNRGGRILPIRLRDLSKDGTKRLALPPPFNALRHFDFRSAAGFEGELQDLLRRIRNEPIPRGRPYRAKYSANPADLSHEAIGAESAEAVSELLISNLAPLMDTPATLFAAETPISSLAEFPLESRYDGISLLISDGRLFTFADLEDPQCPLNALIDPYKIERFSFREVSIQENLTNYWLALANKCLASALRKKRVSQDEKGRFYFLPNPDGTDRTVSIGNSKPREVAAKKHHHVSGQAFWVHYSASLKFRMVGALPFLRILPSYSFTRDGVVALDRKASGRFRIIWGGKQDSATVLRQVLFWLRFISDGHEELTLETGGPGLRISAMPAVAEANVGIALDHIQIKALVDDAVIGELNAVADSSEVNVAADDATDDIYSSEGGESHETT